MNNLSINTSNNIYQPLISLFNESVTSQKYLQLIISDPENYTDEINQLIKWLSTNINNPYEMRCIINALTYLMNKKILEQWQTKSGIHYLIYALVADISTCDVQKLKWLLTAINNSTAIYKSISAMLAVQKYTKNRSGGQQVVSFIKAANGLFINLRGADLSGLDFPSCNHYLKFANLKGANLSGLSLIAADLAETELTNANLSNTDLKAAKLTEAHLENACLQNAHLEVADLKGSYLENANLQNTHLEGVDLTAAHLKNARLENAHLEGAKLEHAHLEYANFENAVLKSVHMQHSHLENAILNHAKLQCSNLENACLTNAKLTKTHLEYVNLQGANLQGADLTKAYFDNTNLSYTNLCQANLQGTYCEKVLLDGAQLAYTNLSNVTLDLSKKTKASRITLAKLATLNYLIASIEKTRTISELNKIYRRQKKGVLHLEERFLNYFLNYIFRFFKTKTMTNEYNIFLLCLQNKALQIKELTTEAVIDATEWNELFQLKTKRPGFKYKNYNLMYKKVSAVKKSCK